MLTGMTIFIVIILFFAFFVFYKRGMISKMFTLNAAAPAGLFQEELERTADAAIRRLETQIAHLEMLLDEADAKIELLDRKLQEAEGIRDNPAPQPVTVPPPRIDLRLPAEPPPSPTVPEPPAAEEPPAKDILLADRRKLILTMAGQGYSVTEIAKTTGTGKGEIMLLLQLNKK